MEMKKLLFPALLSAVMLLTGCRESSFVDYSVSHKAYLDYSLGE